MSAPYFYERVTLVRVVDGDTIVCDLNFGFRITSQQVFRLRGIDAPESNRKESAEAGRKSKDALIQRLSGKTLTMSTHKTDKYGRYVCDLFADGENVCAWMVDNGFARRAWED
jgi:endonuclease YncB( thermonuclease family)